MTLNYRFFIPFVLFFLFLIDGQAQRALTVEDLTAWQRVTDKVISDNGRWSAVTVAPWEGDATVYLYNHQKKEQAASYAPAGKNRFSFSSAYWLVEELPSKQETDSLKLRKTKKNDMPMNRLLIRHQAGGEERIDSIRSYRVANKADWMAYQRARKDSTLVVRSLNGEKEHRFPAVSEFAFATKAAILYYISQGDTLGTKAGIYSFDIENEKNSLLKEGDGLFKKATWDETGSNLAFLYREKNDSTSRAMELWLAGRNSPARKMIDRADAVLPEGWIISEEGGLRFFHDDNYIVLGTAPEPRQKDTTQLAEYRPNVQVWSWNEPVQYTAQVYNKERDLKKTYTAVYHIQRGQFLQVGTEEMPNVSLPWKGEYALAANTRPYSVSSMWEYDTRQDTYAVSLITGERCQILQADYNHPQLSPNGQFAYWYARRDSAWYTYEFATEKQYRLTTPDMFTAWDEQNDVPDYPSAHGAAGWAEKDAYILLYDRYDIWRFDPRGVEAPVNLTANGRKERINYRLVRFDREKQDIDLKETQLLTGFNETTKGSGYYEKKLTASSAPKTLLAGNYRLTTPVKAKEDKALLYTQETFEQFPEVILSDLSFKKSHPLTHMGEQQKDFKWGTAELVSWTSLDGKRLEGVLCKPVDFDPTKKYPMIVNFYERNSENLYGYHMPEPHRSTVDYHMYNSQDYLVFNPDVVYETGYPGESCYNCVIPGVMALIEQGFVDEQAIGAQGHSWGAYQVAYLATRTRLFAAIESGAPVVNMFSAYGGIRWGSGLARAFQYEHTQSRIGGTPWSAPREFMENSPLFTMDKVETPILIMHNDNDGHVPWYQGIEYFVALKRLQKPAWLLNYPGEIHWPMKMANREDFQKRMLQFFNHYLKKEPMPKWMQEGVPAVDQDFELGY
ncbi:dipeptidyl aminopeptidase/acylaminoacyl peptidase [Parabacteroides sp. PFB2-12]|uniref:alpha/beta hydrolase family protein n=1 Tax=unclassified Parabacteroides TaxID=2649774 RepID=UPI0024731D43|nr:MULTISPECIES: prolyl oligopeptidase family serine peptidase [unclassified Parabacteroides]MDH6341550.1 dipeptidyl aminopeptidase/acylaminoacyl peptidase [Parabacteroides sp. PM6-13]MDH6390027.1 dipeptidyl aminopeptidase/acylaminoacyl peptidase [Parabacteroides sp. PFB2-12]